MKPIWSRRTDSEHTEGDNGGSSHDGATMSLMEHLGELRNRLVKCSAAVIVAAVVVYIFYNPVFRFATAPYCRAIEGTRQKSCDIVFLGLVEGFTIRLRIALYLGVVGALPVLLWQLWSFIAPGLYRKEKRYALAFVVSSLLLFLLGATLAYVSLPKMFEWLIDASGQGRIENRAEDYFRLLTLMVVAFGVGFEFPLLLTALQMIGVVTPDKLASVRRFAIVGIVIVVAVITPGGDPISLTALSVPLIIFYECSIWIGRAFRRRST